METNHKETDHKGTRGSFSGKLGFVLSAAGASVGLGNIWRFPYLAAKHGGGMFLLVYLILAITFGYTMIVAETCIGRITKKSPVGAFRYFHSGRFGKVGGWINSLIPLLIIPYYSVIGGWVLKYLAGYAMGQTKEMANEAFFGSFMTNGTQTELFFIIFIICTMVIIYLGVRNGIERVSRFMMPVLVILALIIMVYSVTRPGALTGVKYLFIPNLKRFSWMTVVAAMGQMFYSLSIAMGILITFGSYMKDDVSIDEATRNVEIFDTGIAVMAGLMIIPAIFAFSNGDPAILSSGPSLMFVTLPKVFASMGFGRIIGLVFFLLVFFAALTSSIALAESVVSTLSDEFGWSRHKSTLVAAVIIILLGTLSALGYGPLAGVTVIGMQFLDFFDFLTNSVMMPIAAVMICLLVVRYMGIGKIEEEMCKNGHSFGRKGIFNVMIRYICPIFLLIILASSIASVFGWIKI